MTPATGKWPIRRMARNAVVALLLPALGILATAQPDPQPPPAPDSSTQLLSAQQLDNLIAPIALYPDPLLAQVLAAATYPLELVEVQQWVQDHRDLRGQQLMDAAKQQNWDPSVQAMVAFPDVVALLSRDVRWTTDLGNAFLAQQADVMGAVQRMRARAQANGRLATTQQQRVTTETQDGESAIDIEPADPQVIYVPSYNPAYVWGPPAYGYYPPLWYPTIGFGFGFYPPCFLGGLFGGFGLGFGWGWGFGWFSHSLFLNGPFFAHYGFHGYGGFAGRGVWAHNSMHRLGVPYSNHAVASRFGGAGNARMAGSARSAGPSGGWRSFNNERGNSFAGNRSASPAARASGSAGSGWHNFSSNENRGAASSMSRSYSGAQNRSFSPAARSQNYGAQRSAGQNFSGQHYSGQSNAGQHYSAPHYSAPRSSGGSSSSHFSAPHASAPHSSGGGGGHSSGGGHSGGGDGGRKR
jgi:uncharacterized membrane protein YgcG